MSIYIEELENLRLYKRKVFLPIDKNDKRKGSAVLLLTPNFNESKNIMLSTLLMNTGNLFRSYYLESSASFIINNGILNERAVIEYNEYKDSYEDALEVFESLSDEEKKYVTHNSTFVDSDRIIFRHVEYNKKEPIAFIDIYTGDPDEGVIVYAIKKKYRGKNLSSKLLDIAISHVKNNTTLTKLVYKVDSKNTPSLKKVKSLPNFKLQSSKSDSIEYVMSLNEDFVYHGTTVKTLKTLKPYKSTHGKKYVYGTPSRVVALWNIGNDPYKRDGYIQTGSVDGKFYIKEMQKGALEKAFKNVSGSIYQVKDDNFTSEDFLTRFERVSTQNEDILSSEDIDDVLKELEKCEKEGKVKIIRFKEEVSAPFLPFDQEYIVNEGLIRTSDAVAYINEAEARFNPLLKKALYIERLKTNKEVFAKYDNVKTLIPYINKTFLELNKYKRDNIFIDWSYYTELFFKNLKLTKLKALEFYYDFIDRYIFDKRIEESGYNKKTVFVTLTGWNIEKDSVLWDYNVNINPISVIYRYIKNDALKLEKWKNVNFVFIHPERGYFKVDFNDFQYKDFYKFSSNISKLMSNISFEDDISKQSPEAITASIIDKIENSTQIKVNNLTGGSSTITKAELDEKVYNAVHSSNIDEKKEALVAAIKNKAKDNNTENETLDDINNDTAIKQLIIDINQNEDHGVQLTAARISRINKLRDDFLTKKINNTSVRELIEQGKTSKPIPKTDIKIDSIDDEWEGLTHPNFEKVYDINSDILAIMDSLSEKSNPVSIVNYTIEDVSTSEDSIYLYTFQMEDANGKRFTLAYEIPKFKNNRFMKLRGNDKTINGQLLNLPIIKTDEDTAQIVSNYNKIFIRRFNTALGKSYPAVNRILKSLEKLKDNKNCKIKVQYNDNSFICRKYELPIDYIDLASVINKIEVADLTFYFNQDEIRKLYKVDTEKDLPVGYNHKTKEVIYAYGTPSTLIDHTLYNHDVEYAKAADTVLNAKRYTYSKASILNTEIPVIVIMGYSEGLQSALKKANITYEILDSRQKYDKRVFDVIKFKDGYIKYLLTANSSLLMNGLKECNTEDYSIKDMNQQAMWLDFLDMYGGRIKADGLDNFYDLMMDPITVHICKDYDLPYDYCEALAYASNLLTDNKYNRHVDITGNRFRTNEIVAAYVYKVISTSYAEYRNMLKRNKKEATMTVKRSAVIDAIMLDPTFSDLSILTPLLELESANSVSFKGLSGMNSDRSYGLDKRTFDESMINKLAASTGFAGNIGITRQATIDMAISSNRGLIKKSSINEMSDSKSLCITEALTPFGSTHDDPFRTAMTFIQTAKHGMRTTKSDPLLVSNGADMALPYLTSNEFAFKAKANGVVKEVTNDYIIIEYTDKTNEFIDLRENIKKNSDGGFFVTIKLDNNGLKKGSKFKEGQILAYDKISYSDKIADGEHIAFNIGNLAKIAIMNTDEGFEDSAIVSKKLSNDMTSHVVIKKDGIVLPKNTNIYNIVKKGQPIQEGEPLMVFQNAFEDETANKLLKTLTIDEEISDLGHIPIKSKITGIVKDIKIYRTVEKDELSPSLKKLVNEYESEYSSLRKTMKQYKIDDKDFDVPDYKLEAMGKLKNATDSVMIEFYLEFEDKLAVGDKIVYYSALKGVIKDIFPEGKEPYTDFRPNEKIHSLLAIQSLDNRMVTSVIIIGYLNKILIEMDRQVKELMGVEWTDLDGNGK